MHDNISVYGKMCEINHNCFHIKCIKGKYLCLNALSCILTYYMSVFTSPCIYWCTAYTWPPHFPNSVFFSLRVSDFPVNLGNPKSDWNKTLIPLITVCFFKLDLLNLRVPDPISFKSLEARPSADAALCKMLSKNLICHMSSNLIHKTNLHWVFQGDVSLTRFSATQPCLALSYTFMR